MSDVEIPATSDSAPGPALTRGGGWGSILARFCMAVLGFETLSGLWVTLAPFHPSVQWGVLVHTVVGAVTLLPVAWYCLRHVSDYRGYPRSHITVLGWVGLWGLVGATVTGLVLGVEGFWGIRTEPVWRQAHLISTVVMLVGLLPHLGFVVIRQWTGAGMAGFGGYVGWVLGGCVVGGVVIGVLGVGYPGTRYVNAFPSDYNFLYGTNRPFAPSLAKTDSGHAFDERSLAGSESCGTAGCHEQITQEWRPSAHRYAAMDTVFQGIQTVMAKQNGAESTRYCGGCHDPISLFSGTKNIFADNLTGLHGYQEGISCLSCHAIRETDIKGNANYTVTQPREYLFQWATNGLGRVARDFLIRTYPGEHGRLSKRAFKKPEYCAACHKQFIDAEVNRVGWVQLQNQYDNWAASHWNKKGDPTRTVECRECHMPLVESHDPASGDSLDYNRTAKDGKHRSHRFIAANTVMPVALSARLPGWKEQFDLTEKWLRGELPIPEISGKWANGPIVKIAVQAPTSINPGENIPLRVVMTSNKVGHDFPTGPLDIIQSWVQIEVRDDKGRTVWGSGRRDARNFLEQGTFLFKAEPVDQNGNLIDRHNLWEMVGVRFRRALFPGYSDSVQYSIPCAGALAGAGTNAVPMVRGPEAMDVPVPGVPAPAVAGSYDLTVSLQYRKIDQFLLNFLFGDTNTLTSPVTEVARATARVTVLPKGGKASVSSESGAPLVVSRGGAK